MGEELLERLKMKKLFGNMYVLEYKELGICIEALEKQVAKKPNYDEDWICPNCITRYDTDYGKYDYCPKCGQKLDYRLE